MIIQARPFRIEEQLSLLFWHHADSLPAYIIARVLILSRENWSVPEIAFVFKLNEGEVINIIQTFNEGCLQFLAPHPYLHRCVGGLN